MSRWRSGVAALLVTCGAVSGCASSTGGGGGGTGSSSPPVGGTVRLAAADNGRHVTVPAGATVVLTLDNTYWHMSPVSSPALRAGKVAVHSRKSSIPGTGSGTVVATYRAVKAGRAVVAASRTTCGEALRCSPAQSRYRVTVVVR
jgi:hypothetical protein